MPALLLAAALAAAAPHAPAPGVAPELWRGARVGMTLAEVQALFPQGRPPSVLLAGTKSTPNAVDGGAAAWSTAEDVFGRPALATYYFAGGRLLEVVVNVSGLRLRHTRDNVETARDIQSGLSRYYGPARVCVDSDRRGLARLDCRWRARNIQVGLSYVDYDGLGPNLDVAVRAMPGPIYESGEIFSRHGQF